MGRIRSLVLALVALLVVSGVSPSASPDGSHASGPDVIGEVTVLVVVLRHEDGSPLTPDDLVAATSVIEARLDALSAPGTTVTPIPVDRVRIDVADPARMAAIRRVATAHGELLFVPIPASRFGDIVEGEPLPPTMEVVPLVDGSHVTGATVGSDDMGQPELRLDLDTEGAALLDAHAASHQWQGLALVLDGIVVTVATITAPRFGGSIVMSGPIDVRTLSELAAIVSGGVLPVIAEPLDLCPAPAPCPVPSPELSAAS